MHTKLDTRTYTHIHPCFILHSLSLSLSHTFLSSFLILSSLLHSHPLHHSIVSPLGFSLDGRVIEGGASMNDNLTSSSSDFPYDSAAGMATESKSGLSALSKEYKHNGKFRLHRKQIHCLLGFIKTHCGCLAEPSKFSTQ